MACTLLGPAHICSSWAQPCSKISQCVPCSHRRVWKPTLVSLLLFLSYCWLLLYFIVQHFIASYSLSYEFVLGVILISLARLLFKLEGYWKGTTDPPRKYEPFTFWHSEIRGAFFFSPQHLFETSMLCTNYSCHFVKLRLSWRWTWLSAGPEVSAVPGERIPRYARDAALKQEGSWLWHVEYGWVVPY